MLRPKIKLLSPQGNCAYMFKRMTMHLPFLELKSLLLIKIMI